MLYVKAFHIIFMVAWFAGLFYLPRLFVYHADCQDEAGLSRFKVMERRLFYAIMTPAALVTSLLGLWMLYEYAWAVYQESLWLHIKLGLVVALLIYHFFCWRWMRAFANNTNIHSSRFFRLVNEVPTIFLLIIVILAVAKPF